MILASMTAGASLLHAQAQMWPAVSRADGLSVGVFTASRAFQSTVDDEELDMMYATGYGGTLHMGISKHAGVALRVQAGKLDTGGEEPSFAQADLTFRYTFRSNANKLRPTFDIGYSGYAERQETISNGTFEQRAALVTLALGTQYHFTRQLAAEVVWSAAGGRIYKATAGGDDLDVADNILGAGGLSLGLVWHLDAGAGRQR